jgi:hypothetical protein
VCDDFVFWFWLIGINSQREFRSEHKHTDAHHTKRADQEEGGAQEGEKDRKKREIETSNKRSSRINHFSNHSSFSFDETTTN